MTSNYIFPDFLAKMMAKVDLRTQYEASMLSMSLMAIGLIITITYLVLYLNFALWYKIVLIINGLAGLLFFSSYLVTTFQAYKNLIGILEFQKIQEIINKDSNKVEKEGKNNGKKRRSL